MVKLLELVEQQEIIVQFVCYLICVKPEFQGQGIGLRITSELKKIIEENVLDGEKMQIELTPTAGNEAFYEKAGVKYNPDKITEMYLWIKKQKELLFK